MHFRVTRWKNNDKVSFLVGNSNPTYHSSLVLNGRVVWRTLNRRSEHIGWTIRPVIIIVLGWTGVQWGWVEQLDIGEPAE